MPRIAGTHVSLDPPPGFVPAAGFAGYAHPDREAAIAVTELPTPHDVLISQLSAERLTAQGGTVRLAERRGPGWWVQLSEQPWTGPVERWMVALGNDTRTALVVATAPSGDPGLAAHIEAALATAAFDPAAISPFDGLRFRVQESGGLAVAARSHGLVVLTEAGQIGKAQGAPMLTVGSYAAPGLPADWPAFAQGHLKDLAQVEEIDEIRGAPLQIEAGYAYELTAQGRSTDGGHPLAIYLLAAAVDGLRVVVSGLVALDERDRWWPHFRAIAQSLSVGG